MRRSIRIPMRFKIMMALLLLVTGVVSAISFTMANLFHADKNMYISDVSALVSHHAAEEATVILEGYRGRLESYGHVATDSTLDTPARNALLKKLVTDLPELVLLVIHDDGERIGALYDHARLAEAGIEKREIEEYLERNPLPLPEILSGRILVENATVSPRLPVFRMAVALSRAESATPIVVEAVIGLEGLVKVATRSRVFGVSLVDRHGVVISDRDIDVVTRRTRWDWMPEANEQTLAEAREFRRDGAPTIGGFAKARLGGVTAVAQVPKSVAYFASRELLNQLGTVSLLLLVATALVGLIWSRTLTRPIARLVRATEEIGQGRFDVSVKATSSDEIGTLSDSFNRMASELDSRERALREAQVQLIHSEKMAAFGQLGAGFAHEIKNPLAGILGLIQLFQRQAQEGTPIQEGLSMMEKETKRCKGIIENLLRFARQEKVAHSRVDVGRVIEDAAAIMRHQLALHHVDLVARSEPDLHVTGNANQLQQVLMNLTINAQQAMRETPEARVELTAGRAGPRQIAIRVRDNGPGIPKEIRQRIFEPFFTTKPPGEGTGLGLSVSFGIVKDHHGTISLESEPGKGTCFVIVLPERAAGEEAEAAEGPPPLTQAA